MVLFSRETKRLRARRNQLQAEVYGLASRERRLADQLRKLAQREDMLRADKTEMDDGD
jgi:cell division protein FtsB